MSFAPQKGQKRFDDYIREILDNLEAPSDQNIATAGNAGSWLQSQAIKFVSPIPSEGMLMDYKYDMLKKKWDAWITDSVELIPPGIIPEDMFQRGYIVPSNDFVRGVFLASTFMSCGKSVMVLGNSSTGKHQIIEHSLDQVSASSDLFSSLTIPLHRKNLDPHNFQDAISDILVSESRDVKTTSSGKQVMVYLCDLAAPFRLNEHSGVKRPGRGFQPPSSVLEKLRFLLDKNFWFEKYRNSYERMDVKNIRFCCTNNISHGRFINERLHRHFGMVITKDWDSEKLSRVFSIIAQSYLKRTNHRLKNVQALYVGCVIDFLERCKSTFVPSPNHPHYRFGFFEGMNILGGIFGISSRSLKYSGPPQKARLVMHECMRVVGDRMMMRQDMVKLKTLISSTIIDHFGNDLGIDKLVDGSGDASSKFWHSKIYEICKLKKKPLIFTNLVGNEGYIELTRLERAQDILQECATKLCENAVMNGDPVPAIVPFHFTVKHFLRASRILSKTNNHILMTGHASSGKHTVMQLVAQAHGMEYQEVNVDKIKLFCMWGSVLRNILLKAAKKISIVLVIRCNDIYDDVFHDLYCILKGRFKHLLDHDTVMQVYERFRDDAVSANAWRA